MKTAGLATLKFFALVFLLPGLAGLIASGMISVRYLDTIPTRPEPEENRIVPRGIHGTTVYQTPEENSELNRIEFSSVGVFVFGLGLGVIYLEKWGAAQMREEAQESKLAHHAGYSGSTIALHRSRN